MRTLIQNANPRSVFVLTITLFTGLMINLSSCTDVEEPILPDLTSETDPATKYAGYYQLQENVCPSTKQPLEIRPFTPIENTDQYVLAGGKMISITNLGELTNVDITATWNGLVFVIKRQKVLHRDELSFITGELCLHDFQLSVFYNLESYKQQHSCVAEYFKS